MLVFGLVINYTEVISAVCVLISKCKKIFTKKECQTPLATFLFNLCKVAIKLQALFMFKIITILISERIV